MERTGKETLDQITKAIKEHDEKKKLAGDNFTVFDAFNVLHDELAWSALIAYLLNPQAEHNCGDAFLKLFIKKLFSPIELDTSNIKVTPEKSIGELDKKFYEKGGRIDILIEDGYKRAIIIENKIFAQDQPKQLYRYNNYANDKQDGYVDYRILYLTRFGSAPSADSTNGITKYECISYIDTVKSWLKECLKICEAKNRIYDFIEQTISAIDKICKQTIVDEEIENAIERIWELQNMKPSKKIEILKAKDYTNYAEVKVQCMNLIKQYQQEQFGEVISEAGIKAEVLPFEGVLDGYWFRKADVLNNNEIKSIYIMHDWADSALYGGIEFKETIGEIYEELVNKKLLDEDKNNQNTLICHFGLDDFDELYKHMKKILDVVCKIS